MEPKCVCGAKFYPRRLKGEERCDRGADCPVMTLGQGHRRLLMKKLSGHPELVPQLPPEMNLPALGLSCFSHLLSPANRPWEPKAKPEAWVIRAATAPTLRCTIERLKHPERLPQRSGKAFRALPRVPGRQFRKAARRANVSTATATNAPAPTAVF